MARIKPRIREGGNRLWDLGEERAAAESLMNQRLGLFLILFAIIIVGAINTQKKILFLSVMFIGAVICWVLAYTIIRLARKIGFLTKEIDSIENISAKKIDRKGGGKSTRFLLGYFVPIFCSSLLVLAFLIGSSGLVDSYLWVPAISMPQVEQKVEQVKNDIKEKIIPRKDTLSQNFQSVDKVISDSKIIDSGRKYFQLEKTVEKEVTPKTTYAPRTHFKNIDSVMVTYKSSPRQRDYSAPKVQVNSGAAPKSGTDSRYFKDIRSIIVEDNSGSSKQSKIKVKKENIFPQKSPQKEKFAPPSPHFKNIDSVIKK